MPEPPEGEAALRRLAQRFEEAEQRIRGLIGAAVNGDRSQLLTATLAILVALRQEDLRRPAITAYITAFKEVGRGGDLRAPNDLAGSLEKRLDEGAQTASQSVREAFRRVNGENLEETATAAVTAHTDRSGTSWTLGHWATMNCDTIGRQATSRGLAHAVGEGNTVTINVGECGWCREHAGEAVVGQDPLPPYHPGCTCVASAA
jgi:hypothetical protein